MWPSLAPSQSTSGQMLFTFSCWPAFPLSFLWYECEGNDGGGGVLVFAFGPKWGTSCSSPITCTEELRTKFRDQRWLSPGTALVWTHFMVDPRSLLVLPLVLEGSQVFKAPPHTVIYGHFAPVGQFEYMGLSFMGNTFIPSEKQPD